MGKSDAEEVTKGDQAHGRGEPLASRGRLARRTFLGGLSAGAALAGLGQWPASAVRAAEPTGGSSVTPYQVGVGKGPDPYAATQRAIAACGQWPWSGTDLAGRTVVIKPNLVIPAPATTGVTTDPQVVRAIVDQVLAAGATQVKIVELGARNVAAPFGVCGYTSVFTSAAYPQVQLLDLSAPPYDQQFYTVSVPNAMAYQKLTLPSLLFDPNVVLISAAKMKTHVQAGVTLTQKNLFGFASPVAYAVPSQLPRQDLHFRGVYQAIIDLNQVLPIQFGVVDGIWGMQGLGPMKGTPVNANVVVAGRNPLAIDWICMLKVMGLPSYIAPYFYYAAAKGMGPADPSTITVLGDVFTPQSFVPAMAPPLLWHPTATPWTFSLATGQQTAITYNVPQACQTRVEIIHDSDLTPGIAAVRTLRDWANRPAGSETLQWDGRNDSGTQVIPGLYLARVQARLNTNYFPGINYATGFVQVNP